MKLAILKFGNTIEEQFKHIYLYITLRLIASLNVYNLSLLGRAGASEDMDDVISASEEKQWGTKKSHIEEAAITYLRPPKDVLVLNELSDQYRNETLYTVLGVVLGAVLIVLATLLIACIVKQRQQQRLMGKFYRLKTLMQDYLAYTFEIKLS